LNKSILAKYHYFLHQSKMIFVILISHLVEMITSGHSWSGKTPQAEFDTQESGSVDSPRCPFSTAVWCSLLEHIQWNVSFSHDGSPIIGMIYRWMGITITFSSNPNGSLWRNRYHSFSSLTTPELKLALETYSKHVEEKLAKSFQSIIEQVFDRIPPPEQRNQPDCVCLVNLDKAL
jgi:hypothetical protein